MKGVMRWLLAASLGGAIAAVGAIVSLVIVATAFWPVFVVAAAIVYLWRTFA